MLKNSKIAISMDTIRFQVFVVFIGISPFKMYVAGKVEISTFSPDYAGNWVNNKCFNQFNIIIKFNISLHK